jgi:hypothetical protein
VTRGALPFAGLWRTTGAIGPAQALAEAAEGFGALSLPGSVDGTIRHVPLFVEVAGQMLGPSVAVDAIASHGWRVELFYRGLSTLRCSRRSTHCASDRRIAPPVALHEYAARRPYIVSRRFV